jgi:2-C-methyl-D-erythritol 2,4-cyclodiphosphate synthase
LQGHSDADALLHAVTDALLGAAAMGDIGEHFPDTDEENEDRDSGEILQEAYKMVRQAGWKIVNIDCIVFAEKPKLGKHKMAIRQRMASLLDIGFEQVGLKAKTGESVGHIGRGEALSAECVAMLHAEKPSDDRLKVMEAAQPHSDLTIRHN